MNSRLSSTASSANWQNAGVKITWAGGADTNASQDKEQTLTLARPGVADALGLTIGCVRVGRFRVCLECGWIYCRIVIKGRF